MTIDEAIRHAEKVAEGQEKCAEISVSEHAKERISKCAADHRQLAEWLTELKEAKRLLKLAIEDMNALYEAGKDEGCLGINFKWRYADEVLKLIGNE